MLTVHTSPYVFHDILSHSWPPVQSFRKLCGFTDARVSVNRGVMMRLNEVVLSYDVPCYDPSSIFIPYALVLL
jgi:hypothetical protein